MNELNRRDFLKMTAAGVSTLSLPGFLNCAKRGNRKPNIVYILADDLGYGDLSCYGQKNFETPNIDKLAAAGMRFTQHYSGSTVCAPSRSSLMTGLHTGHTPIRGNKKAEPEGQVPLPAATVTIAELLKKSGYVTGAFGKWGLGAPGSGGDPNKQGFDEFFGHNCQGFAHHYYPHHLWHNQERILLEENEGAKEGIYAPILIHQKRLQFIEDNQDHPFFLYVPSIIPHAELFAPEAYLAKYRGKFEPEKSYHGVDSGERFRRGAYGSQPEAHAAFAAMINVLDDQVGEIMAKLRELNLEQDTIIMFSSDNGPHLEGGADPDYFDSNGPLQGYKRDLYEGGIRVPFIAKWPGKIAAGSVSEHVSAFWDLLPTMCDIVGIESPRQTDGISFYPELIGKSQEKHSYLYWEFHEQGGKQAVRMGDWKAVRLNIQKPEQDQSIQLYNLKDDLGETKNLADEYPEIVAKMAGIMKNARTKSDIFPLPELD